MPLHPIRSLLCLALFIGLSGCGGGSDSPSSPTGGDSASEPPGQTDGSADGSGPGTQTDSPGGNGVPTGEGDEAPLPPGSDDQPIDPEEDGDGPVASGSRYSPLIGAAGDVEFNAAGSVAYGGVAGRGLRGGTALYVGNGDRQRLIYAAGDRIVGVDSAFGFEQVEDISLATDGSIAARVTAVSDAGNERIEILLLVDGDAVVPAVVTGQTFDTDTLRGVRVGAVDRLVKFPGGYAAVLTDTVSTPRLSRLLYSTAASTRFLIASRAERAPTGIRVAGVGGGAGCEAELDMLLGVSDDGEVLLDLDYDPACGTLGGIASYTPTQGFRSILARGQAVPGAPGFSFDDISQFAGRLTRDASVVITTAVRSDVRRTNFRGSYWVAGASSVPRLLLLGGETVDVDGQAVALPRTAALQKLDYDDSGWFAGVIETGDARGIIVGTRRETQPYPAMDVPGASSAELVVRLDQPAPAPYADSHRFASFDRVLSLGQGRVAFSGSLRRSGSTAIDRRGIWLVDGAGAPTLAHEYGRILDPSTGRYQFEARAASEFRQGSAGELLLVSRDSSELSSVVLALVRVPIAP